MRQAIRAPACKDEVQLATGARFSSQGGANVVCVSHSGGDVLQQQLICSYGRVGPTGEGFCKWKFAVPMQITNWQTTAT